MKYFQGEKVRLTLSHQIKSNGSVRSIYYTILCGLTTIMIFAAIPKIINNKVRVFSNKVINPKHIRYGWKNWVMGSLFNKENLPASSFNSLK